MYIARCKEEMPETLNAEIVFAGVRPRKDRGKAKCQDEKQKYSVLKCPADNLVRTQVLSNCIFGRPLR
jgi:hypothetical protein